MEWLGIDSSSGPDRTVYRDTRTGETWERCECGRRFCRGADPANPGSVLHRIPVRCSAVVGDPGDQDQLFRDPDGTAFSTAGSTEVPGVQVGDEGWMLFVAGERGGLWRFQRDR